MFELRSPLLTMQYATGATCTSVQQHLASLTSTLGLKWWQPINNPDSRYDFEHGSASPLEGEWAGGTFDGTLIVSCGLPAAIMPSSKIRLPLSPTTSEHRAVSLVRSISSDPVAACWADDEESRYNPGLGSLNGEFAGGWCTYVSDLEYEAVKAAKELVDSELLSVQKHASGFIFWVDGVRWDADNRFASSALAELRRSLNLHCSVRRSFMELE